MCYCTGEIVKYNPVRNFAHVFKDISHSLEQTLLVLATKYLTVGMIAEGNDIVSFNASVISPELLI
ncbi:hypothetical protein [Lacrimispora xylanisolvens]|uniref:hypothetical protein n=1 Tax=Lacrimispora xylanisolvens TaxID=384636 RepID=UPI002402CF03